MQEEQQFTVAIVQQSCTADKSENLYKACAAIREAKAASAQIVCLQELFSTIYPCQEQRIDLFDLAEDKNGPTLKCMRELAAELELTLVVPFFEVALEGLFYNSAAVLGSSGEILGIYRKMHLPQDPHFCEKYYFSPGIGDCSLCIFDTPVAKFAVMICWDQWFPEAARAVALMGAELIFYPTAIGLLDGESGKVGEDIKSAWKTVQRSHAIANGLYVASANRVGHEGAGEASGVNFFGKSFVCDPFGRMVEEANGSSEQLLLHKCDRNIIRTTRREWPFLRDRRIDAYRPITDKILK